jgi:hypothetical protein
MRWAVLVAVAACSGRDPTVVVDASQPPDIMYSLRVGQHPSRPAAEPTIYIDGVATNSVSQTYLPGETSFLHHVELRYEDHVLATYDATADIDDCGRGSAARGSLLSVGESLDAYDSGDLRYTSDAIQFENGGCIGDGFDIPRCGCSATERCMPRIALADPLFTHLDCAPIGPKQHGDACTLVPDPAGAYDDCGAGLFCYQGTCHLLCVPGWVGNGAGSALPEGYPNDALLCD